MKTILSICFLTFSFIGNVYCLEMDPDEVRLDLSSQEPLFVSLGSVCEPAHMLRYCDIRKMAFPFDWIVSMDGQQLIKMLNEDFCEFLNERHFFVYPRDPYPLFHTYYHLEFLHEGNWKQENYFSNLEKFLAKYQRRIERFRLLRDYKGRVFFIRAAYPHSLDDPHRYYRFQENLEITDEYALRLYEGLKKYFPKLKFTLLLFNYQTTGGIALEKKLSNRIFKIRSNSNLGDISTKTAVYKKFFSGLIEECHRESKTGTVLPCG